MMPSYLLVGIFFVLVIIFYSLLDSFLRTKVDLINRSTIQGVVLQKRSFKSKFLFFETEYLAITIETLKGKKYVLKGNNRLFSNYFKISNLKSLSQIEENQQYTFEYYTGKFNIPHICNFKLLS